MGQLTKEDMYDIALKTRAYEYLNNYQHLDLVAYFEMQCTGPVIAELVRNEGAHWVIGTLGILIEDLR
jgi:hypothetical protein